MIRRLAFAMAFLATTQSVAAGQSPASIEQQAAAIEMARMQGVLQWLRSNLVDPGSAQASFPFGFTPQPMTFQFLGLTVTGYMTCGAVNSRNRFGGYTGMQALLAIADANNQVQVILDNGQPPQAVTRFCNSLAASLPPIRPATQAGVIH